MENQYYHFHCRFSFPGDTWRNRFSGEASYKHGDMQTAGPIEPQRVWSQGREESLICGGRLIPQGFSGALGSGFVYFHCYLHMGGEKGKEAKRIKMERKKEGGHNTEYKEKKQMEENASRGERDHGRIRKRGSHLSPKSVFYKRPVLFIAVGTNALWSQMGWKVGSGGWGEGGGGLS